jgi:hypothetical protein
MHNFSETNAPTPTAPRRPAIAIPAPFEGASTALGKEFAGLRSRCELLEASKAHAVSQRDVYFKSLEAEANGDDKVLTPTTYEADEIRDLAIENLRLERAIRRDLASYIQHQKSGAQELVAKLRTKIAAARADVTKKLLSIGFLDPTVHKIDRSRIMPGMIFEHPKVRTAEVELDAAKAASRSNSGVDNRVAIEDLQRLIRQIGLKLAGL